MTENTITHDIAMDYSRQQEIINPEEFNAKNIRIDVIGVGATGSWLTMILAKMGLQNIHVWDADIVEKHNLPNQLYRIEDIGKPKVIATKDLVKSFTGIDVTAHAEFVDASTKNLGNVIFLLTDTMRSRKEICQHCLSYNMTTSLCIETRLAAKQGRIYAFNPSLKPDLKKWESSLYEDKEANPSACGMTTTLGASASYIASMAVLQMIKWYLFTYQGMPDHKPELELLAYMAPSFNILNTEKLEFND
jgi:molybdopterin/thiamine biosynthesis adenylyltransferase